jgi:peptide/nickel transport system permease protein
MTEAVLGILGRGGSAAASGGRKLGVVGSLAALVLVVDALLVIFGSLLAPHDPNAIDLAHAYGAPSFAHLLGQDGDGRDILSRVIVGARTSLLGPLAIALVAATVGGATAVAAAWRGGWLDSVLSRIVDVLFAFPGLLLAILAVALFGPGLSAPVIALAIAFTPGMARVTRSAALRERNLPYVDALTVQGLSGWRISTRHLVPNLSRFLVAQITVSFGYAFIELAGVSFLGLGVQAPDSDWGLMVANGETDILRGYPEQSLYVGAMIVITIVALNILGNRFSDRGHAYTPG